MALPEQAPTDFFVTSGELSKLLKNPETKIVDASWYLPAMNRDGKAEYDAARIPRAVYFDINAIADTTSKLPHMLPTPEVFAKTVGAMGISETDDIIIYDGPGVFSSARVWWTFRTMGAKNVRILAKGIDGWKAQGRPLETGTPEPKTNAIFVQDFQADKVRDYSYMLTNIRKSPSLVLDARPYERFTGDAAEPRPGLRSGHIPGSKSLPASDLIENGELIETKKLAYMLIEMGVDYAEHVTTSCGSGVTAAIISLALETCGYTRHSLYDGSWADWGSQPDAPVARWK
jgi:thiosulfate/3-mercaptopyruvate sulfurtransferase